MTHPTIGTVAMGDSEIRAMKENFEMARELVQEAKGADWDQSYVIAHLDEAEGWINKIEDAITAALSTRPAQEPVALNKPARVGSVVFRAGVSAQTVIAAAQRLYEHEDTAALSRPVQEPIGYLTGSNLRALSDGLQGVMTVSHEQNAHFQNPIYAAPQPVLSQPEVKAVVEPFAEYAKQNEVWLSVYGDTDEISLGSLDSMPLAGWFRRAVALKAATALEGGDASECHHYPKPGIYRAGKFITDNCESDEYRNEYVKGGLAIVGMVSDATGKRFMTQEEYDAVIRDREAKGEKS